jgi:hypothetical protein
MATSNMNVAPEPITIVKGNRMPRTPDEILDEFIKLLNFHYNHDDASIQHHSYKGVFFRLCREASVNGYFEPSSNFRFTGEALNDRLSEHWTKANSKREKLLTSVLAMWDEWRYVLEQPI